MCGLSCYVANSSCHGDLLTSLEAIKHRGPDHSEIKTHKITDWEIGLGHNRLSIIDLDARSNQPFTDESGFYTIIYNGEIYNFQDLKKELPSVEFRTQSDTEVVLELYMKYGVSMLRKLEGMFAFVILDQRTNKLIACRDSLGIKPLYYYYSEEKSGLFIASELKALFAYKDVVKKIDKSSFAEFFLNGFLYEPDTGFNNVKKLPPGCYAEINLDDRQLKMGIEEFCDLRSEFHESCDIESIENLLKDQIDKHLVSDVPLGLFFSGGIDSSLILSRIRGKIDPVTFRPDRLSIRKAGIHDDYYYAEKIAGKFNVSLRTILMGNGGSSAFLKEITDIAYHVEEPIADYTFIASRLISNYARREHYKVMLSGMGADELFAGYNRYLLVNKKSFYQLLLPFVKLIGKYSKRLSKKTDRFISFFKKGDFIWRYSALVGVFSKSEVERLLRNNKDFNRYSDKLNLILEKVQNYSDLKKSMYLDIYGFLSHNFTVADKSSMLEGLELRVPLATKRIAKYSFSLPDTCLINGFTTKSVLKKILSSSIPRKWVYRPKTGFNPPLDDKILNLTVEEIHNFIMSNAAYEIIDRKFVEQILNENNIGSKNRTYQIFQILFFAAWYGLNK